jgi:hypothetical protein
MQPGSAGRKPQCGALNSEDNERRNKSVKKKIVKDKPRKKLKMLALSYSVQKSTTMQRREKKQIRCK